MRESKETRFEQILSDKINGNLSDFRERVKRLSKKDILDFVEWSSSQGIQRHEVINAIRIALA